jgi:transposase
MQRRDLLPVEVARLLPADVTFVRSSLWTAAAQELRLLYREPDRDRAERWLLRWFTTVAEHEIPELLRLARTLDAWREELLAYFATGGMSNGPTEAINGLIKKVENRTRLPQCHQLPFRLLLHCGIDWQTSPATPIRGRLPRLAA